VAVDVTAGDRVAVDIRGPKGVIQRQTGTVGAVLADGLLIVEFDDAMCSSRALWPHEVFEVTARGVPFQQMTLR
jgi:hypothetical protein